jgi:hypothetical protein
VRYKYSTYRIIKTPIVGTFKDLWPKLKDKYLFFCADVPPETIDYGYGVSQGGMRLDEKHLDRYGLHKAWVDPNFKVNGRPVVLVWNAD